MSDSNTPRRILLVRHGQTEWNKDFRFQGKTNVQLTDEGKRQAELLALRLKSWQPQIIYTSPLDRAKYTASAIAEKFNMTPVVIPELEEINFADWEGQSIKTLKETQPETFYRWRDDPFFNPPPNAETWDELSARLSKAAKTFTDNPYNRIIVVSHGGIMKALYAVMLGLNPHKTWNMEVSNCAMSGIEIRHGHFWLIFANDNLHVRAGKTDLPVWSDN